MPADNQTTGPPTAEEFDQPFTVWRWLRDRCDWPMREKMAYWCLYSRRGPDGSSPYPGLRRLAADMGTTKDPAHNAVRQLQELGALHIESRRVAETGEQESHLYRLQPPWLAATTLKRKPRGKHAALPPDQPGHADASLEQGQVSSKQGQVSSKQGQGVLETGTRVSSKQGHNEPTEGTNEGANKTVAAATRAGQPRTRKPSTATDKTPDPHNQMAQPLVQKLDAWLKAQGAQGVPGDAWGRFVSITAKALKGGAAGAPIPAEEAEQALDWAMGDRYWRGELLSYGMSILRKVWGKWKTGDRGPARKGNQYVDPAADGPKFLADSPWNKRSG